jgi:hypothetical protein
MEEDIMPASIPLEGGGRWKHTNIPLGGTWKHTEASHGGGTPETYRASRPENEKGTPETPARSIHPEEGRRRT